MTNQIDFSIIIPTHGRSNQISRLSESIVRIIDRFMGEIEVIIVDSSHPDEASIIQQCCDQYHFIYLRDENHVCKKRNRGIYHASKPYLFFTDSDCYLEADVLSQHASKYYESNLKVVGVLGLTKIFGKQAPIWKNLQYDASFTAAFNFADWLEYAPWGTCTNLSLKQDALLEIGGFDNHWPLVVYGEDVDLGLRITQTGKQIACNPHAIVYHDSSNIRTIHQIVRKKWKTGQADFYLGKKHPDLLAYEFPDWISIFIISLPLMLIKSIWLQSLTPFILIGGLLLIGILIQSFFGATQKSIPSAWFGVFISTILENIFVAGRIKESAKHGAFHRIWKKFIYVEPQLLAERDRRIAQAWAIALCMVLVMVFLKS